MICGLQKTADLGLVKEIKAALLQLLHKASQGLEMFPDFRLLHQTVFRYVYMSFGMSGLFKKNKQKKDMQVTGTPGRLVSQMAVRVNTLLGAADTDFRSVLRFILSIFLF